MAVQKKFRVHYKIDGEGGSKDIDSTDPETASIAVRKSLFKKELKGKEGEVSFRITKVKRK